MTTNARIAHDFFYSGFDKTRSLSGMSVSYVKHSFYSYYTTIGYVTTDKAGNPVTLISRNNMSQTTSRHLWELRSASPYPCINVEVYWGDRLFEDRGTTLQIIAGNFKKALGVYSRQKMSLAKNRNNFVSCYLDAKKFSERVYTLDFLKDFEKTYIDVTENVKQIKAKQRRVDKGAMLDAKQQLNELLKENKITEISEYSYSGALRKLIVSAKVAYFTAEIKTSVETLGYAKALENIIRDSRRLRWFKDLYCKDYSTAYACFVDHTFKTTKGITISEKEGRIALKAWKTGKLKVGDCIRIYKVLLITPEFVRIGCHTIPTKNLEELCEILGI